MMHILAISFTLAALILALAVMGATLVANGARIVEALIGPVSLVDINLAPHANVTLLRASHGGETAIERVMPPLPLAA